MSTVFARNESTNLKEVLAAKIPIEQENVKNFRKEHGNTKIGEVTVDMVSVASVLIGIRQIHPS